MRYTFMANIYHEDNAYIVAFPDIPSCFTSGDTLEEAIEMAEDVLNLMLWDMEESGTPIPSATLPERMDVNGYIAAIHADTAAYRKKYDKKPVQRAVSLPRWLDAMAKDRNIRLSAFLQTALMKELGVAQ